MTQQRGTEREARRHAGASRRPWAWFPACAAIGLAAILAGCEREDVVAPALAASARQSGLDLAVRVSPVVLPCPGRQSHAAVVPVPLTASILRIRVRALTDPAFVEGIFPIVANSQNRGQVVLPGIAPGVQVPVTVDALDSSGRLLMTVTIFLDFFEGQVTTNETNLDPTTFAPDLLADTTLCP